MFDQIDHVRRTARQFCVQFITSPYLCYTEHGLHALFFTMLFNSLPDTHRYIMWTGQRVCTIQKEYPTAGALGKPTRQHWDIAVIKSPPESIAGASPSYDYLRLAAAVEFGMNSTEQHLRDDISRLSHPEANVDRGFVIHLDRLSAPGTLFSGRDWSARSGRVLSKEEVAAMSSDASLEILYGMYDATEQRACGVWVVSEGRSLPLT